MEISEGWQIIENEIKKAAKQNWPKDRKKNQECWETRIIAKKKREQWSQMQ